MKEWDCVEVKHHRDIGKTIVEYQGKGWRLHTYQTAGMSAKPMSYTVSHYLLFERGARELEDLNNSQYPSPFIVRDRASNHFSAIGQNRHSSSADLPSPDVCVVKFYPHARGCWPLSVPATRDVYLSSGRNVYVSTRSYPAFSASQTIPSLEIPRAISFIR